MLTVSVTQRATFTAQHALKHVAAEQLPHPHSWWLEVTILGLVKPVTTSGSTRPVVMGGVDPEIMRAQGIEPPILMANFAASGVAERDTFDPDVGTVIDPAIHRSLVRDVVDELGDDLNALPHIYPTLENIALYLWDTLDARLVAMQDEHGRGPVLMRVRLGEEEYHYADVSRAGR